MSEICLFSGDRSIGLECRAYQIYLILIGCAHNKQVVTYDYVAEVAKAGGPNLISRQLKHIMFWCDEMNLPPLTVLVVRKDTGLPGEGLLTSEEMDGHLEGHLPDDWPAKQQEVFHTDWYDIVPPTSEELQKAYINGRARARQ